MPRLGALLGVSAILAVSTACIEENPCDRWADYVCQCHDGEPGFDSCSTLRDLALDPSAEEELQCDDDLRAQTAADEEAGLECAVDSGLL